MWSPILDWLKEYWFFLTAITAITTFILYDRRLKKLEIEKLELEVKKLRSEALIYRPSREEIKEILEETRRISNPRYQISGSNGSLFVFGIELRRFLTQLLAYYGDHNARTHIYMERSEARSHYLPDMYGDGDLSEYPFPSPERIKYLWDKLKDSKKIDLPVKTVEKIDAFLNRFSLKRFSNPKEDQNSGEMFRQEQGNNE